MSPILRVDQLSKVYANGHHALGNVSLHHNKGEVLALLGANGAGKTTLISIICGIIRATSGKISINGFDHVDDFRAARSCIGLVPQELTLGAFDTVWDTVRFSRGVFSAPPNDGYISQLLENLSLQDKKNNMIMQLSGGMKRRVLIAKALAHEPDILFLDEPTAGVDVELRKGMWDLVSQLRDRGVTIILTTHYIEEAEAMADRISIMRRGKLVLTEKKDTLMKKLGRQCMKIQLQQPVSELPPPLIPFAPELSEGKDTLYLNTASFQSENTINDLLQALCHSGLKISNLTTEQSSLEDIFVDLINQK